MRHTFKDTEERCKVCGGRIEKAFMPVGHYNSNLAAVNIGKVTYDYETSKLIGHRCSDCGIQYLILEER